MNLFIDRSLIPLVLGQLLIQVEHTENNIESDSNQLFQNIPEFRFDNSSIGQSILIFEATQ